METRGRKRAEATSPAPSSSTTGPTTRSSKRIRLSATTTTTAAAIPAATTKDESSVPTRSRGASRSQDLLSKSSMDSKDESSGSAPRGRRGKQQRSGNEKTDKGKGKGKERVKETERNLGLNVDGRDEDDNNSEGGGGDLQQNLNLSSANTALQGLLRKLGAGLDDLLPSSAMASGSSSHQNGRLKKILSGLRADGEQGKQVESLTQLCEILSIGTEVSLSTFSVDSFVPVLVRLLNHESNADIMLLSARALTHLCDVLPSSCASVVHYGAVACFVARLLTIEYMDLAEQSLQALKKISEDHPTVCLRAGALMAVLSYLDFFSTGVQRVALSTAANMCMKLPPDAADFVMEAVPLLTNLLQYHDAKVLEHASVCLTRIAEAFSSSPEKLDELCNCGLVTQAASLISTGSSVGGQASVDTSTYTGLIRLLSTCASGSPLGTKSLLLLGISGILKDILSGSGLVPNLSVSAALSRPPDQIFEIMNLANELLPALPQGTISVPAGSNVSVRSSSKKSTTEVSPREKLLNEQPQLLQQFGMDLLPVLVQIYGSSLNAPARQKCLSVIAKLMYFSSAKLIESLSSATNISSFLAGVLAWKDPQALVLALKIADILMKKLPEVFSKMFMREGFVHAVDKLIISTSQPDKDKDPITATASRSTRYRRRGANSTADLKSSEDSGNTNYSIRTVVSAIAKAFKDRHFAPDSTKSSVTDDLLHLTNLCSKLNAGLDDFKTKSTGKSKAYSDPLRFADVSKEEGLTAVVLEMLMELSKGEGISTFEFIGSGVVSALLNYFSCGYFSKERVSDSELPKLREQVMKRYKSFVAIALDSSVGESGITHMSVLVQKLQNALSSVERYPVILRHNSRSQQNASSQSQIQSSLSEHLKIRFCRAQGEKSVREHTPSVLLVDPLASLAAVEEFLWPRVRQTESELAAVASTPATTARRGSTRSKSSVKGKAVLKTGSEESRGPHTRNAAHRSAALDKDLDMKPTDGISSNEVEDLDISNVDLDDAMVIEDDDVSDDEEFDQDEVLGDESFPMCAPDKVHDVKLTDSTEASIASDSHSNPASGSSSQATSGSSGLMSFAAAAMAAVASANGQNSKQSRKPPKLIFSTCGKQLSRNITVYHAIQNQLILNEDYNETNVGQEYISSDIYTLMYQSAGTRIPPSPSTLTKASSRCTPTSLLDSILQGELPCDLEKTQPTYNILALLRILESLNQLAPRLTMDKTSNSDRISVNRAKVSFEEFVNNKLTPKLARQIEDTLTICSGCLPLWCHQLTSACPFLFPFETRRQYLYSTAFGIPRAMNRLQHRQGSDSHGSLNEREVRVGRLHRQKVRISRSRILDSAKKVMEMCCDQKSVLEVEYFGEVGTGLGPTLEFFTLVSQELRKGGMGLWREDLSLHGSKDFVQAPLGLFPRPWNPNVESSVVTEYFRLVGRVIAKALQDGRLLDLPLSIAFFKLALGQELDLYDIVCFDAELGKILQELEAIVCRRQYLKATGGDGEIDELSYNGCLISDLCLDFTLPGYPDYILKPGDDTVDINNLDEYITLVVDATLRTGIMRQIEAFRAGFNQVFDISTLRIFSPNELDILLCGRRELWEPDSLADSIKFDHGYTSKSPPILNLLEIMGEFTADQQRTFCQFVTGAPRLPPGGLAALKPKLTIVRKHSSTANNASSIGSEASESADSDLPSVMTCANYLKLPPYSTKEIMYKKLMYAINEGQGSFDLS